MEVTTIGIDIAKRIFQIYDVDKNGKTVLKKKLMRDQGSFSLSLQSLKLVTSPLIIDSLDCY